MKFVASTTSLLSHLQVVSRVISNKNALPILDNYLFKLSGNELEITASDLETTMITRMAIENSEGFDGNVQSARLARSLDRRYQAGQPGPLGWVSRRA